VAGRGGSAGQPRAGVVLFTYSKRERWVGEAKCPAPKLTLGHSNRQKLKATV